jgi:hypothetical protein
LKWIRNYHEQVIGTSNGVYRLKIDAVIIISDHQQSWGYEDGPWKGPGPPLLGVADF